MCGNNINSKFSGKIRVKIALKNLLTLDISECIHWVFQSDNIEKK